MAQQTIGIGAAPNDGTGDPIRTAFDKCNDNFTELYAGLTGLLDFKGSTDCSTNPNYPAASKGDFYVVSVAGKIGGASGTDVEVGDAYFAEADNAGGTQAAVGADWSILQGNTTGAGAGVDVQDETTPVLTASTLNFTGAGVVATDAGGGVATITIAGGGAGGVDVQDEGVAEATGATTLNFTGAGVTATDMGAGVVDVAVSGGAGDLTYLGRTTVTAAANVDIALPDGYDHFEITFYLRPSDDNVSLNGSISDDNFATVESGATDYHYVQQRASGTTGAVQGSNGTTLFPMAVAQGNDTNEYNSGRITVTNAKETAPTLVQGLFNYVSNAGAFGAVKFEGGFKPTSSINGLRLSYSAGTATGFYRVWGRVAA